MKNVKFDSRLRIEPSISQWAICRGYFWGMSTIRRIKFVSSTVIRPTLTPAISPLIKKFITLGQDASLLSFRNQSYMNACKGIAITNGGPSQFCLEMSPEFTCDPIRFVERKFHYFNDFYRNAFKISACYEKNSLETI